MIIPLAVGVGVCQLFTCIHVHVSELAGD